VGEPDRTTRLENAHRTVLRALLYPLHPWFGRDVFVHGATDRAGGALRCTLDGSDIARALEIPAWMFDRAAYVSNVGLAVDPFDDLEALETSSALLEKVLKTETRRLRMSSVGTHTRSLAIKIGERPMLRKTRATANGGRRCRHSPSFGPIG
jgi:hypothetical protein